MDAKTEIRIWLEEINLRSKRTILYIVIKNKGMNVLEYVNFLVQKYSLR